MLFPEENANNGPLFSKTGEAEFLQGKNFRERSAKGPLPVLILLAQLGTGGNGITDHDQVQLFLALFRVDGA